MLQWKHFVAFDLVWTILIKAFNTDLFMTTAGRKYWEQNIYALINKNFHLYLNRGWEVKVKGTFSNLSSLFILQSQNLPYFIRDESRAISMILFNLDWRSIDLVFLYSTFVPGNDLPVTKGLKMMIFSGKMRKKYYKMQCLPNAHMHILHSCI